MCESVGVFSLLNGSCNVMKTRDCVAMSIMIALTLVACGQLS